MAGGKRLAKGKQNTFNQRNNRIFTGRIYPIPQEDNSTSSIAVADIEENISSRRPHQNGQILTTTNGHSSSLYKSESDPPPSPGKKFNSRLVLVTFIVVSLVGMCFYDVIAPPLKSTIAIISGCCTILPIFAKLFRWEIKALPQKLADFLGPFVVGFFFGVILVAVACGCLGLRLTKTDVSDSASATMDRSPSAETESTQPGMSTHLPSIGGTTIITEPTTITPRPDEPSADMCCVQKDFFSFIGYDGDIDSAHFLANDLTKWRAIFINQTKALVGTKHQPNVDDACYREFERKTKEANELHTKLRATQDNQTNAQISMNNKIIQLRQDAYEKMSTLAVCNLLADDYYRLAGNYKHIDDQENAYRCYCNSIKWKLTATQFLKQIDDRFYSSLYFIATVYYKIGESGSFPDAERIDALYISACLFGVASQNLFEMGDMQFESCVYAGMANHDLLNLNDKKNFEESVAYFFIARDYYLKAIETPSKNQKQICGYLFDLFRWAAETGQAHPLELPLEDPAVYESLANEYRKRSL